MMNISYAIWSSGVDRWHTSRSHALRRSCDTTDAHTARCLHLLFSLWPDDNSQPPMILVKAILDHDVPEAWIGDVPSPAKNLFGIREALNEADNHAAYMLDLSKPTDLDERHKTWLKLVDSLDAYLWVWRVDPTEANRYEWSRTRSVILKYAEAVDNTISCTLVTRVKSLILFAEDLEVRPETL